MFSDCFKVGSRSCGKTSLVHLVAQLTGNKLEVMAMNSAIDTTELLGGFEQVGPINHYKPAESDLRSPFHFFTSSFYFVSLNETKTMIACVSLHVVT